MSSLASYPLINARRDVGAEKVDSKMAQTDINPENLSRSQRRRREDIIQAALTVFDRDGFEAARMADIAKAADVAKGTLYLYFDSKIALLEGVVAAAILPTLQEIGDAAKTHDGGARALFAHQMRIGAQRMASPEMKTLLQLMITGGPKTRRITKFYHDNVIKKGLALFRATLDYGVSTGEFREEVRNMDVLVLVGAPIYTAVWNILFDEMTKIDPDRLVNDFVDIVLNGLMADPSGEKDFDPPDEIALSKI